jgi:hypothetical protein
MEYKTRITCILLILFVLFISICAYAVSAASYPDSDKDGYTDNVDNCPYVYNPDQVDKDQDGVGDVCDQCPYDYGPASNYGCPEKQQVVDSDQDSIPDSQDNCPYKYNPDQADKDQDGIGDVCDNCPYDYNPDQADENQNGIGDACEQATTTKYKPTTTKATTIPSTLVTTTAYTTTTIPECVLSLCDCKCYPKGSTPEELKRLLCGINCLKEQGVSGCKVEKNQCVETFTAQTTTTTLPTAGSTYIDLSRILNGSLGNVIVQAKDPSGILSIVVYVDNIPRQTCRQTSICTAIVPKLTESNTIGTVVVNGNRIPTSSGDVPTGPSIDPTWFNDDDGDGILNINDNCRYVYNPDQNDTDHDGVGDACDNCDVIRVTAGQHLGRRPEAYCLNQSTGFQQNGEYYYNILYDLVARNGCGCVDTDNGLDYFTRGAVYNESVASVPVAAVAGVGGGYGASSNCIQAIADHCVNSTHLREAYCNADGPATTVVMCPQGCSNDACYCSDTDGGENYYQAGQLGGESDYCINNRTLHEYMCKLGTMDIGEKNYTCPAGCADGACMCTDTDGGKNYAVKGNVGFLEDHCLDDNRTLIEYDSTLSGNTCTVITDSHLCDGRCLNGTCLPPTCQDDIWNQAEEQTDCGGPCAPCDPCTATTLPTKFDWRHFKGKNWLSPVKDQAACGSCWDFASVGLVEAQHLRETDAREIIDLSEQEVLTCSGGGDCNGGFCRTALSYIQSSGVGEEQCLQYWSANCLWKDIHNQWHCQDYWPNCTCPGGGCNGVCSCTANARGGRGCVTPSSGTWKIRNVNGRVAAYTVEVYDHGTPEENFKRGLLCYGPVLVQSSRMDHDFILVGWDDTNSSWIFKNSWGTGFEDNGYGKIPYGSNNTDFLNRAYLFVNGVYNESIY